MSDKVKHTAGPWTAGKLMNDSAPRYADCYRIHRSGADSPIVCEVPDFTDEFGEHEANVAIIAAAPDMYAVLREIHNIPYVFHSGWGMVSPETMNEIGRVLAVIES